MSVQSIREEFHVDLASTVLHDIQHLRSNYYYFLGKVESWGDADIAPLTSQVDSASENFLIRSNALYFRKIAQNDVSLVCKKYVWESGLEFDRWDHTVDMSDSMFYCMNSEYNVYKCLDNNGGAPSTSEPLGKSFSHFKTADGYTWKYMYTIPTFKRTKFVSLAYMPVQKALTDGFYNRGSIEDVAIINSGSGYIDGHLTYIEVENSASGSGATVDITINPLTGQITAVGVLTGGSGYTHGATIKIASVTGSGATFTPVFTAGVLTSVTVVNGGLGYQDTDTPSVSVGGAILLPVVSRETGQIVDIKIIDPGAGYDYVDPPLLTVGVEIGQTPGTGLYTGNSTAIIQAVIDNGQIARCVIIDPGQDYPADTSTTITVSGDGEGAVFTPIVNNGEVIDVLIENIGTGYTYVQLDVFGAGTGAVLRGITSMSDYQSDQSIVEQTTVKGSIFSIKVANGGTNYSVNTTASISGDGTGATAEVFVDGGVITKIQITNPGKNYTYATVTITDPLRDFAPFDSVNASAYAIFPPRNGHGYNAVEELYGKTIAFNSLLKIENGLEDLDIEQEFRQYGIIKNPTFITSGKYYSINNATVLFKVKLNTVTDLVEDEILLENGIRYRVVSFNALDTTAQLQKMGASIGVIASLTAESDSNRSYIVESVLSYPTLDKYSGRMLYISNESPFIVSPGQSIAVKTFIQL